jgi:uncharacterized membrane protein YdbT with pleckstrin-like domain
MLELLNQEYIQHQYHQHAITLVPESLLLLAGAYFPWYFLGAYNIQGYTGLLVLWCVILLVIWLRRLWMWWGTGLTITNKRLLYHIRTGFFQSSQIGIPLELLQDISHATTGLLSAIFGFGTITITSAHRAEPLHCNTIAHGQDAKTQLWIIWQRYHAKDGEAEAAPVTTNSPDSFWLKP